MVRTLDLNQLRAEILENQRRGEALPAEPNRKVFVDSQGQVVRGADSPGDDSMILSEIHQGVFSADRNAADALTAAHRMPLDTRSLTVDDVTGWLYHIKNEFGDPFDLFAYWDGSMYQVKVVFPKVEGKYSAHAAHLFSDGRICFGSRGGLPDLAGAYAKSVLWATAMGSFQRTGVFAF